MRYVEIENGKIINIVEAEPDVAAERGWVECSVGGIGWDYDGTNFIDNRPKNIAPTQPAAPTKEELIAQLQTMQELQTQLQTQIQALE